MPLGTLTTIPILGTKVDVPPGFPGLLQEIKPGIFATYDTGGTNIHLRRQKGATAKAYGKSLWSASSAGSGNSMGLFRLVGSSATDLIHAVGGKVYVYDGSRVPTDITPAGVTFSTNPLQLYSFVSYGDYVVMADGTTTPYKWKNGDSAMTKLIGSGTEYVFRYLEVFQQRILGAYTTETSGDIELRWTDAFPDLSSGTTFPASNQIYKTDDRSITGLRALGPNTCLLYAADSIERLDYYPYAYAPFTLTSLVSGHGSVNNHGIVNLGNVHYFFDQRYGFVGCDGSANFPVGGKPISEDIEPWLAEIDADYYSLITGCYWAREREVVWAVPLDGANEQTALLFYDVLNGRWRREDKQARCLDDWIIYSELDWEDFAEALGGSTATWSAAGSRVWTSFLDRMLLAVYSFDDGHVYYRVGDTMLPDTAFEGYRVEPILDFGDVTKKKLLLEIWFGLTRGSSGNLWVQYRGGDSVDEVTAKSWENIGTLSLDSPVPPVIYTARANRLHQIRYGTSGNGEFFSVNEIKYVYAMEGTY